MWLQARDQLLLPPTLLLPPLGRGSFPQRISFHSHYQYILNSLWPNKGSFPPWGHVALLWAELLATTTMGVRDPFRCGGRVVLAWRDHTAAQLVHRDNARVAKRLVGLSTKN